MKVQEQKMLTAAFEQSDVILVTEPNGGESFDIVANAKGRNVLQELSPDNFPDELWGDDLGGRPGWRMVIMKTQGPPLADMVQLAEAAKERGCRVVFGEESTSDFELFRFATLADITPEGSA
jgi:hypothetical protein